MSWSSRDWWDVLIDGGFMHGDERVEAAPRHTRKAFRPIFAGLFTRVTSVIYEALGR
jgi:hypothetical protein